MWQAAAAASQSTEFAAGVDAPFGGIKARKVILGSAGVIIFSIIVLAIVPLASGRAMFGVALLVAGVVGTAACILSYVWMILQALRRRDKNCRNTNTWCRPCEGLCVS